MVKRFLAAAELARRAYPYVRKYGPYVWSGAKAAYGYAKSASNKYGGFRQPKMIAPRQKRPSTSSNPNPKKRKYVEGVVEYKGKSSKGTQKGRVGNLHGSMRGKLATLNRRYGKFLGRFNRDGIVARYRAVGQGDDQDCVYIMNEAVEPYQALNYSICAVLRKLFEKMNWRVTGMHDTLGMTSGGFARTYTDATRKIHLEVLDQASGTLTVTSYTMLITSDLMAVAAAFIGIFIDYASGYNSASGSGNDDNIKVPVRFYCTEAIEEVDVFRAEIQLSEVILDMYCESTVYIQNRTTSTTGDSADASNVTNHPVHGNVYYFKGLPKARTRGEIVNIPQGDAMAPSRPAGNQFGFEPVDLGCKILGSASLYDDDFKYPPESNFWWNCVSSGKATLDPGAIKHYNIKFKKTIRLLPFCKALRMQYTEVAHGFQTDYSMFPVQMIGMTSVINSANHEIDIGVEIDRIFAVKAVTKKQRYFRTHVAQQAVSETVIQPA